MISQGQSDLQIPGTKLLHSIDSDPPTPHPRQETHLPRTQGRRRDSDRNGSIEEDWRESKCTFYTKTYSAVYCCNVSSSM
jgi:hypothetical protein